MKESMAGDRIRFPLFLLSATFWKSKGTTTKTSSHIRYRQKTNPRPLRRQISFLIFLGFQLDFFLLL